MQEDLTPLERGRRYFAGEEVDRLPCGLLGVETGCTLYGISPREALHSVEKAVRVQKGLVEEFEADSVGFGPDLKGIGEALGTKICYPEWNICYVQEPVLKDYRNLDALLDIDLIHSGRMPMIAEVLERFQELYGKTRGVSNMIAGPLSTAAAIRGTENLLKDMRRNKEELHRLMKFVVEVNLKWIQYIWDRCEAEVSIADPVASADLLGLANFQEFEKPYLQALCEGSERITGSCPSLHICGKTSRFWPELRELKISGFSLDNCESLEAFKQAVGDRLTIGGNIDPTDVMRFGTPQDVDEALKACLKAGSDSPRGYIPGAGCQIPLWTPRENLMALVNGVKTYTRNAKMGRAVR